MKITEKIMGMDSVIEVLDNVHSNDIDEILEYLKEMDEIFSPYKKNSQIRKLNNKRLRDDEIMPVVRKVLKLCEETKKATNSFFDINIEGHLDPSGLVKGFAMKQAVKKLLDKGFKNFFIEIDTDIDVRGHKNGQKWRVGIKNPLNPKSSIKILSVTNVGVATSGYYKSGIKIYNPLKHTIATEISYLTVVAPDIYEADRFSTAIYAMGKKGFEFTEEHEDLEGYFVMKDGSEKMTSGFHKYLSV